MKKSRSLAALGMTGALLALPLRAGDDWPKSVAGPKLWLKADGIAGLSNNDPITTWSDSSGQGNNCTSSGSNRPTYQTNVLLGTPRGTHYFKASNGSGAEFIRCERHQSVGDNDAAARARGGGGRAMSGEST